ALRAHDRVPDGAGAVLDRERAVRRHRPRQGHLRRHIRKRAHPRPEDGHDLLGPRPGAWADRHLRVPARLHGLRAARVPDRDGCRGRVLEAARGRFDVRLRVPGVHHRRRDPPDHPAHRHHAAVRELRRLERRRELHRAGRLAARPRPSTSEDRVNDRIRRIAVVAVVLLAALIIGSTYWQTWAEGDLAARKDNAIQLVAQFKIDRGDIHAGNLVLARNHVVKHNGQTFYLRTYPHDKLAADLVGYSTQGRSRAGLESSLNDYLTSSNSDLHTILSKTLDSLEGKTVR